MTSLSSLLIEFAIVGALMTGLIVWAKKQKNTLVTFFQHFCGVWFIFSGLVKAVDPIGTAYKMEDYFAAFSQTFEGLHNVFANIAPVFPLMAKFSLGFSIFMVVLEIILGVMLILGYRPKLTAWLFFLLVVFFTLLTGFTYMSGYVPTDANFFDFAKWGPYIKSQMRVTDCGCFGDFIKLDPKISFFKDLGLMIPALLFLLRSKWMHQLWSAGIRQAGFLAGTALSILLCYQNAFQNLPMVDFRPFKIGTNVREKKEMEEQARSNVQILGWKLKNNQTGEEVTFMEPKPGGYEYLKQYPKDKGWKVIDQVKNEPHLKKDGQEIPYPTTKVSDFSIEDPARGEITDELLNEKGYSLIVVSYKLYGEKKKETITVQDTVWAMDTIQVRKDSISLSRHVASVQPKTIEKTTFVPSPEYAELYQQKVNPLAEAAAKAGWKTYALVTYQDSESASAFFKAVQAKYPYYKGDDKLLKTIIRANPGIVVMKDGQVLAMYHHRHLPTFDQISK
jgi:uncharacterized membrane protein YphA (DoxX/SURF4 family)